MNLLDKLFVKNYKILKVAIILIVCIFIILIETFNYYFYHKAIANSISDSILTFIITCILVSVTMSIINKKQKQLDEQLNQLAEAYKYIGQINRKIDALLELDISTLDHSKNSSFHDTSESIFTQLLNLIDAQAGYLHINTPSKIKIFATPPKVKVPIDANLRTIIETISHKTRFDFKTSQNPDHLKKFINLGFPPEFFDKYHLITKPVYMHRDDIGHMMIIVNKDTTIESRDLNIIRVYSFYLALNATFKPVLNGNTPKAF